MSLFLLSFALNVDFEISVEQGKGSVYFLVLHFENSPVDIAMSVEVIA